MKVFNKTSWSWGRGSEQTTLQKAKQYPGTGGYWRANYIDDRSHFNPAHRHYMPKPSFTEIQIKSANRPNCTVPQKRIDNQKKILKIAVGWDFTYQQPRRRMMPSAQRTPPTLEVPKTYKYKHPSDQTPGSKTLVKITKTKRRENARTTRREIAEATRSWNETTKKTPKKSGGKSQKEKQQRRVEEGDRRLRKIENKDRRSSFRALVNPRPHSWRILIPVSISTRRHGGLCLGLGRGNDSKNRWRPVCACAARGAQ